MRRKSWFLGLILFSLFLLGMVPSEGITPSVTRLPPVRVTPPPIALEAPVAAAVRPFDGSDLFVHLPPKLPSHPLRVVVALHGMGGQGEQFAQQLIAAADKQGWLLIAPTIHYHDYLDLPQLIADDLLFSQTLHATIESLPQRLGVKTLTRVAIIGFSRGAQLGHRFALFYPDHVLAVAALSAGSYTLPHDSVVKNGEKQRLLFPYGIADMKQRLGTEVDWRCLKRVTFMVGVGGDDNHSGDVARAFDPYEGNTRVDRARAFEQALEAEGLSARLYVFPHTGHELTSEMSNAALQFFHEAELSEDPG